MMEKIVKVVLDLVPKGAGELKRQMEQIRDLRAAALPGNIQQQIHLNKLRDKASLNFAAEAARGKVGNVVGGLLGEGAGKAAGSLAAGAVKFAAMAGPIVAAAAAVVGLVAAANKLAKAASPVMAQQQERAWNDLMAVVGRAFLPVLQLVTESFRLLADVLNTILPSKDFFLTAAQGIRKVAEAIRSIPGVKLVSSVGASGYGASYMSGEDFSKQQALAALGSGSQPASEGTLKEASKLLRQLVAIIQAGNSPGGLVAAAFVR